MTGKLTNAQLEILKVFAHPISEQRLEELRKLLFEFKAKQLIQDMDQHWDLEQRNPDDLLQEHLRTPYR